MSFKHAVLSPAAAASRSSELRIFLNFLLTTNSPRSTDTEARGEPLRRGEALRADAGREGCAAEVGTLVEEEEDASGNDPEAAAAACGDGDGVRAAGVDGFFAADEGGGLLMRAWTVRASGRRTGRASKEKGCRKDAPFCEVTFLLPYMV